MLKTLPFIPWILFEEGGNILTLLNNSISLNNKMDHISNI